jgi:predicted O-linked N-acetylglucosamine transferase (SPINDLY family)
MDYIIGDSIVIPEEHNPYYNEKIIRLPNCYQINNNDRFIPKKKFSNNELGLPNQGFVFCNFNNNYKINQEVFDIWIKLLKNIDNSVLWLLETNSIMKNKLLDYATSKGISKNSIVFAPKININDHLSRHLNADLFLDTFVYNAHTTGSDSLWCGVPIITKLGSSFPARVGASLLNGVNLKRLITKTSEEYYQLAHYYSQNTLELKKIKDDLIQNRKKFPLFNSKLFCKNIEIAFRLMVNNYQNKKKYKSYLLILLFNF